MKLIEAMKQLKSLNIKAEDFRKKISVHCADLTYETPLYPDQKSVVDGWLQAHSDVLKEILRLRLAIQRTNLATQVVVDLGGAPVTKSIAEWIHRRRDLAKLEMAAWSALGDRGLKEGNAQTTQGTVQEIRIRRYYNPMDRDQKIALYREEPMKVDAALEIVNAVTDLKE